MRTATGVRAGAATMALLALTACGPTNTAAPIAPATTAPTPTPTVSTTNLLGDAGTTSTTAPTTASGAAGMAKCTVDKLKVTAKDGDAGSGHRSVVLLFTNVSAAPCRLFGYPGVAALDAHDTQVAQARRTLSGYLGGTTQPATTVDISSGQSASALIEASAFGPGDRPVWPIPPSSSRRPTRPTPSSWPGPVTAAAIRRSTPWYPEPRAPVVRPGSSGPG